MQNDDKLLPCDKDDDGKAQLKAQHRVYEYEYKHLSNNVPEWV